MGIKQTSSNQKIPLRVIRHLTELAEVPRSEYLPVAECNDPSDEKSRRTFFGLLRKKAESPKLQTSYSDLSLALNCALWMRVHAKERRLVSFFVLYGDDSGDYAILVDEAEACESVSSVMLTSNVILQARGELRYIKAACTGLEQGKYIVDELYVQHQAAKAEEQRRTA